MLRVLSHCNSSALFQIFMLIFVKAWAALAVNHLLQDGVDAFHMAPGGMIDS